MRTSTRSFQERSNEKGSLCNATTVNIPHPWFNGTLTLTLTHTTAGAIEFTGQTMEEHII